MLANKAVIHLSSKVVIRGLQLVGLLVVARLMGPEPIGMIAYAGGVVGLFSIIGNLGFATTHRKKISEGKDLGRCIGTYLTIRVFLLVIWFSCLFLWVNYSKSTGQFLFETREEEYVLYIVASYTAVYGLTSVFRHTFWANLESAKSSIPQVIARVVIVTIKIAVAFLGLGVIYLASAQLIGYTFLAIIFLYLLRKYPIRPPNKEYLWDYIRFTIPLMLSIPFSLIASSFSIVLIGYFWDVNEVAYFTISLQMVAPIGMFAGTIGLILLPIISSNDSLGKTKATKYFLSRIENYMVMFLAPIVFFLVVYADSFTVILLGENFKDVAFLLKVQVLMIAIISFTRIYSTQLISTGHVDLIFYVGIFSVLPILLLNIILIPEEIGGMKMLGMGAKGAVFSTLTASILEHFIIRFFAYKTIQIKPNPVLLVHLLTSSVIMFLLFHLSVFFSISDNLFIILFGVAGFIIHYVFLKLIGVITDKDLIVIKKAVNPKMIKESIVSEF